MLREGLLGLALGLLLNPSCPGQVRALDPAANGYPLPAWLVGPLDGVRLRVAVVSSSVQHQYSDGGFRLAGYAFVQPGL